MHFILDCLHYHISNCITAKNNKRLTAIIIFIIFPLVFTNAVNWKEIVQKYGPYVCFVEVKNNMNDSFTGSGFLVNNDGLVITNAHVIKEGFYSNDYKIKLKFLYSKAPEKEYAAKIEKYSEDIDIGILKIEEKFSSYCALGDSSLVEYMDEILIMGYPLSKNFKSTPGYIQSIQDIPEIGKMFDMNIMVDPGNSGGPVFNSEGVIIGIVTAKFWGYNFNLAIPINIAKDFMSNDKKAKTLTITSEPSIGRVFINGSYKGQTPLKISDYGQDLEITVEKDGYQANKQKVLKSNEENKTINFNLIKIKKDVKKIIIDTTPSQAEVYIDNDLKGKTPLTIDVEGNPILRLRIHKPGFKDLYQEVRINDDPEIRVNIKLN